MALSEFIKLFQHSDFIGIFIEITLKKIFVSLCVCLVISLILGDTVTPLATTNS